jgi:hypothetical protein
MTSVDFDIINQLLMMYSAFFRYHYRKKVGVQWDFDVICKQCLEQNKNMLY